MMLADLQRDLRAWLTRGDAGAAARFGPRAAPGLGIYQNNYRAQLAACLEDAFEYTREWIGGAAFHDAVVAHVDRLPPGSWTLDAYPRDFPATLAALYPQDPEVAELAWLEMALGEVFVAPDASPLAPGDVGAVDWDRAVLRITPSLDLADLTTNAAAIWSALAADQTPPGAALLDEAGALLVWREGEAARFRAVDQYERQALLAVRAGLPFADFCAAAVEAFGEHDGVALAGRLLGQWLGDGLIVDIEQAMGDTP